ncbi:MAG: STAS domain-containing protein [Acidimicrobiia bacterium]|nr:STAS domain-containing protein [Acidimicrobiia bacterium]
MTDETSELTIAVEGTTIRAVGEVDYTSSSQLHRAVDEVLAGGPGTLIDFDLGGVEFMDSSGLAVLVEAENRGAHVRVSRASSPVKLVIEITGLQHLLWEGE